MFTSPAWSRRGVARGVFAAARAAAEREGFRELVLTATLPGVPLYRALGFDIVREFDDALPNGERVPVVEMTRAIRHPLDAGLTP